MKYKVYPRLWTPAGANDLDAFIPEVWAQESLMMLENELVAANLVHRDFEDEIAAYGDVVNTRQPAAFEAKRKTNADDVTVQDADATNVAVKLDQHLHTSFVIKDGEESKGFQSLRDFYLVPALHSIAQAIDEIVLCQMHSFFTNAVGKLGTDPTVSTITDLRALMTTNKVPQQGRNLIITPNVESKLSQIAAFHEADKIGDDGSAMREGSLGRKFGFQINMDQNCPTVSSGNSTHTAAINLSAGYAKGSTAVVFDAPTGTPVVGEFCTIAGDMTPQLVTATNGSSTMTVTPGLKSAVLNNAVITFYTKGAINYSPGPYAAGYAKELVLDGFSVAPQVGQPIAIAAATGIYGALSTPTTTSILLNRALDVEEANNDVVGIGPVGEYCFGFHRNAISLVSRPLATPAAGTGALSYVASYEGLGIRVTITYEGRGQGHLVTVDLLLGTKVLNTDLGALMYG